MRITIGVILIFATLLVYRHCECRSARAPGSVRMQPAISKQESESITSEYHNRVGPPTDPRDPRFIPTTAPTTQP